MPVPTKFTSSSQSLRPEADIGAIHCCHKILNQSLSSSATEVVPTIRQFTERQTPAGRARNQRIICTLINGGTLLLERKNVKVKLVRRC